MIVSVKKLNVLWTHQSKGSDDSKIVEADFSKFRIEFEDHENLRRPNCEKPSLDRRNVDQGTSDLLDTVFCGEEENISLKKDSSRRVNRAGGGGWRPYVLR